MKRIITNNVCPNIINNRVKILQTEGEKDEERYLSQDILFFINHIRYTLLNSIILLGILTLLIPVNLATELECAEWGLLITTVQKHIKHTWQQTTSVHDAFFLVNELALSNSDACKSNFVPYCYKYFCYFILLNFSDCEMSQ